MPSLNNLTVQDLQWGTANWSGQGYIDGLKMVWNSANSFSVTSGSAYVPSLNRVLPSPALLTLAGLALTASTWYHVYLYGNPGSPAIECVTTAPAAAYYGTARAKTGDTSRRYIGSVLTDASGNIYAIRHFPQEGRVAYERDVSSAPFKVVAGNATTATSVSCSGVVPVTAQSASLFVANNDTTTTVYLGNANYVPTTTTFIAYVGSSSIYTILFQLDSSLAFQYLFNAAPASTFVARVSGYTYER